MKKQVALLGATGPVGQRVITMLENHPHFTLHEIAASDARVGQNFAESITWRNEIPMPTSVAKMKFRPLLEIESPYVISALPTEVATEIEPLLAARGHYVFSNAASFRMDPLVPLMIPEINSAHLSLLEKQQTKGKIVTNPNCSTVFLAAALAPLQELGTIEHVSAVTMQALSGAGYPGVSAYDLMGNLIPHIGGEEAKIQSETKKILGAAGIAANFGVTVHVHRVPVVHGHTVAAHVRFKEKVSIESVRSRFQAWADRSPNLFALHEEMDRPQPAKDLTPHEMRIHLGRFKQGDDPHTIGFISLGHNLVRGAAGAAIANMESTLRHLGAI